MILLQNIIPTIITSRLLFIPNKLIINYELVHVYEPT